MAGEIAQLSVQLDPEELNKVIAEGRLQQFVDTVARGAAAQITAQIVDHVARAAVDRQHSVGGSAVTLSYVFEGGDFGTRGPHGPVPHGPLQRLVE